MFCQGSRADRQLLFMAAGSSTCCARLDRTTTHLLFMLVAATARMSVPCISTWHISSLLLTRRSHAPAKLTPVGSSRMVTTGRGADELVHSRSRTSSCKGTHVSMQDF